MAFMHDTYSSLYEIKKGFLGLERYYIWVGHLYCMWLTQVKPQYLYGPEPHCEPYKDSKSDDEIFFWRGERKTN